MWRGCSSSTATSNSSTEAAKGGGGVVLPRWVIYISLLLLRFIGIGQRGYVHPDEFYQGGQELFFGRRQRSDDGAGAGISCTSSSSSNSSSSTPRGAEYVVTNSVPWEYQPIHAVRSIVPPAFMTLVPIRIYAAVMHGHYYSYDYCVAATMNDDEDVDSSFSSTADKGQCNNNYHGHTNNERLSGIEILLIPRLFMTILSIIFLDGSLWLLVSYRDQQKQYRTATTTTTTTTKTTRMKKQQQQQTIATLLPSPPIEVIILASSWPCLVLSTRPFTNSLETMCVAVLLVIIVRTLHNTTTTTTTTSTHDNTSYYCSILPLILIGITCSIGIFIRFTFAFFALPSVIIFLYHRWKKRKLISNNKSSSNRLLVGGRGYNRLVQSLLLLLQHVLYDGILWIIVSFALVSYIFIYIDTQYYYTSSSSSSSQVNSLLNWNGEDENDDNTARGIFSCPSSSSQSQQQQEGIYPKSMLNYITPMNALLYNSKQDNLALHGLHSRITHIAINMPLLFGPLTIIGFIYLLRNLVGRIIKRSNNTQLSHISSSSSNSTEDNSVKELICQWTIISGVIILSCAPHQEPRFLLPTMVPLVYLHGRQLVVGIDVNNTDPTITNKRRSMILRHIPLIIWIVFNTIVYIFFGRLHQGGLLDSLLHLNDYSLIHDERDIMFTNATVPRVFVYYKTYMPPTFLTRAGDDDWTHEKSVEETKKCDVAESGKCDQSSSSTRQRKVIILDLKGANSSVLLEVLHEWLPCHGPNMCVKDSNSNHFIQLISIPAAILPLVKKSNGSSAVLFDEYTITTITSYDNHISTEDWPAFEGSIASFINQLRLDVYIITCGSNKMR